VTRPPHKALKAAALTALVVLLAPAAAEAHALVGKKDLPIPAWLFAWGASLVLIVSFFVLSVAWHENRFEERGWRPVADGLARIVLSRAVAVFAGLLSVLLLGVGIWTGLYGVGTPDLNFSLTFFFVTAWLGLVILSVVFGNVFRALNPWRAIARGFAGFLRLLAGRTPAPPLRYPERLGRWPAAAGIFLFIWLELVFSAQGFSAVGVEPHTAAIAALVYSAYALGGMALFGIEAWLDRGEAFSAYFGMFSQLSVFEVRDGKLGRRKLLSGMPGWAAVPGSLALVLVTIGGTTFDGAQEGFLAGGISSFGHRLLDVGFGATTAVRIDETVFMILTIAFVAGVYWLGVRGMHLVRNSPAVRPLGITFGHTLIPIALAYLTAHYFSLFVFQEQAQFSYLITDPLGHCGRTCGAGTSPIDFGLISSTGVWYVQVGALIAGHVTALVLAHDKAITVYKDSRLAGLSQRWMLMVMVAFTSLGLFLLSQSNA
jgi:hypothetical protein